MRVCAATGTLPRQVYDVFHELGKAWQADTEFMESLNKKEIDSYMATNEWCGKAGACGFQDGLLPLRLLKGSADTVVGLPVAFIEQLIRRHIEAP